MSNKRYRLLKNLPDHEKGTIFVYDNVRHKYKTEMEAINACDPYSCYMARYVENNPDWFELIEDKEWEIVRCRNMKDGVHDFVPPSKIQIGCLDERNPIQCSIFSVKRLSDNEVFSIGDEVIWDDYRLPIKEFNIVDDGRMFVRAYVDIDRGTLFHAPLNDVKKPQPTQEIFTWTDDEVLKFSQTMICKCKVGNSDIDQMWLLKENLNLWKASKTNTVKEDVVQISEWDRGDFFYEEEKVVFKKNDNGRWFILKHPKPKNENKKD